MLPGSRRTKACRNLPDAMICVPQLLDKPENLVTVNSESFTAGNVEEFSRDCCSEKRRSLGRSVPSIGPKQNIKLL